ncbi:MAG: hypothetical protein PHI34_01585 [Acidobacteriota bacterium]|nr:hypothetical protein [Acidobacteriota bacterium]
MKPRLLRPFAAAALACLLLAPGFAAAQEEIIEKSRTEAWIGIRAGRFASSDLVFQEVYGTGGTAIGLTAGVDFFRAGSFSLAAGLDLGRFARTGASTVSATAARMTIVPLTALIRAGLAAGTASFWLEAGGGPVFYTEDSEWIFSRGSAFGFRVGGGASLEILTGIVLQAYFRWSTAAKNMEDFSVNLGGTEIGGSLLFRFGI